MICIFLYGNVFMSMLEGNLAETRFIFSCIVENMLVFVIELNQTYCTFISPCNVVM